MKTEQLFSIDYSDKVVLVTGSSRGIGRHFAQIGI
jgi:NAD(P)-dependent dehydrogenase (short-subunit alcohol dehydrogenase family)